MKREKICYWINSCGKLKERSYISYGKDSKRYHKSLAKASKGVFTIVTPQCISMLPSKEYSGAIKACKKFAST